jgi:hypothetical protein
MRILLVDANRLAVRIVSAQLEARGRVIDVATDGSEALAGWTSIIRSPPRRAGRKGGNCVKCGVAAPEATYADAG